jgi:beta-glucosidase
MTEIYDAPFAAAVRTAHVASMMCAMGSVNGLNTCSTPSLYAALAAWGFPGFVRSDYAAVEVPAPAFHAGMSLIKPATTAQISALISQGRLHVNALRHAVAAVLTEMFAYGLISGHPRTLRLTAVATSPAHQNVALAAARQSIVVLKNVGAVLPLPANLSSLAVIGVDAYDAVTTRGGGSSGVHASHLSTPLAALRSQLPHTRVTYSPGGLAGLEFDPLNASDVTAGKAPPSEVPIVAPGEAGKGDIAIDYAKAVTRDALTATAPGTGEGWSSWDVTFVAKKTGTYVLGLEDIGDTWLTLNGATVMADRGIHGPYPQSTSVQLRAGASYTVQARWFALNASVTPRFGIDYVQPQINAAVAAAQKARVAVVFASNLLTEGADMPSLSLQGDLDALIEAVAAVNPRTVVVLNTGGAVLTPWRTQVAGVVEAWYPGEQGAQAIAQVLSGVVDATGRLALTMPASASATPAATPAQFPGQRGVVSFGGLSDIGYRWYQANQVTPAYPFGFGLSYSTYRWSAVHVSRNSRGVQVALDVTNTGHRPGADVVEVYVAYPSGVGEAPEQLRGFDKVQLAPGATRRVVIELPTSAFTYLASRAMVLAAGAYRVSVATSSADVIASQTIQFK